MTEAALLEAVATLARRAGEVIMALYARDIDIAVRNKHDTSPVTIADEQAEALILAGLSQLTPDLPVISEEAAAAGHLPPVEGRQRFWLVDPLDGTKEFLQRNGEFTVNIALIERCREHCRPILGVVYAPALGSRGRLFGGLLHEPQETGTTGTTGTTDTTGTAWLEDDTGRRPIRCRPAPTAGLTIVTSRSHGDTAALDALLAERKIPVAALIPAGSSLKLCLIAAGEADLYPRLGRTMEWDIAAGHAVLSAAGGRVTTLDGDELRYAKPGLDNPHFIARGLTEKAPGQTFPGHQPAPLNRAEPSPPPRRH